MYMTDLMLGYAATLALVLVGCRVSACSVPGLRGVSRLSWALCFGIAGVLLLAMRPFAPAWISILVANEALFVSSLLFYCAAADTLAAPMRLLPWGIGLSVAAFAPNDYFTYLHPDLPARILTGSGLSAVYGVATASLFFRYEDEYVDLAGLAPTPTIPDCGTGLAANADSGSALASLHADAAVSTRGLRPHRLDSAGFSYANMVLNLGAGGGLVWLALCIHRRDLHRIARTDVLTGLLNRRAFEEVLTRELRRTNHMGHSLVILLLDIDRFKVVNDTWGHLAGDKVIRQVSGALQKDLRPSDALARVGGEEFVALLRDASMEQTEEIAERAPRGDCKSYRTARRGAGHSQHLEQRRAARMKHSKNFSVAATRRCIAPKRGDGTSSQ